jgi:hypothetical protein
VEIMDRLDVRTREAFPRDRWLGGVRLEAPGRGRRWPLDRARPALLDGPFVESKELVGGLFWLQVSSLDEAVSWARETPFVDEVTLEIRELWWS